MHQDCKEVLDCDCDCDDDDDDDGLRQIRRPCRTRSLTADLDRCQSLYWERRALWVAVLSVAACSQRGPQLPLRDLRSQYVLVFADRFWQSHWSSSRLRRYRVKD